jgi:two-component system chemotaxis sensor kinase CheA
LKETTESVHEGSSADSTPVTPAAPSHNPAASSDNSEEHGQPEASATVSPATSKTGSVEAPSAGKGPTTKPSGKGTEPALRGDANIRVPVHVLDRLMNLAGELVLGKNQLLQTIASNDTQMLDSVGARMDQVTSELQETIMQTRMQQVGTVFNKFTRIVRDLSNMLNK